MNQLQHMLDLCRVGTMSRSQNSRSLSASYSSARMPQYDWNSGGRTADLCFGHPCWMNRLKHCIPGSSLELLEFVGCRWYICSLPGCVRALPCRLSGAPQLGSPRMNFACRHVRHIHPLNFPGTYLTLRI